jgi:hypothetical protein
MTFFPAIRLSAAHPRERNRNLTLIRRNLPKAATQSHPTANVPIPPESYRGLHLVSGDQPIPVRQANPPRLLRSLSALRDRVAALAAALLLILAST